MKNLVAFAILLFGFAAHADFKTSSEAIAKLKTYKAEDFQSKDHAEEDHGNATEEKFFDDLDSAVKLAIETKSDSNLMLAIVQATSLGLKVDDTRYAADVVAPLFEKKKSDFRAALKNLSKKEAAEIEESIRDQKRESTKGNG